MQNREQQHRNTRNISLIRTFTVCLNLLNIYKQISLKFGKETETAISTLFSFFKSNFIFCFCMLVKKPTSVLLHKLLGKSKRGRNTMNTTEASSSQTSLISSWSELRGRGGRGGRQTNQLWHQRRSGREIWMKNFQNEFGSAEPMGNADESEVTSWRLQTAVIYK